MLATRLLGALQFGGAASRADGAGRQPSRQGYRAAGPPSLKLRLEQFNLRCSRERERSCERERAEGSSTRPPERTSRGFTLAATLSMKPL